jgi:hypothetical protein
VECQPAKKKGLTRRFPRTFDGRDFAFASTPRLMRTPPSAHRPSRAGTRMPASQNTRSPHPSSPRSAAQLMIVTLAFIFALGMYNASIQKELTRLRGLRDNYEDARQIRGRYEAVMRNRAAFLSAVTLQHLQLFWRDHEFTQNRGAMKQLARPRYDLEALELDYDSSGYFSEVPGPYATPLTSELVRSCRSLGDYGARAFDATTLDEKHAILASENARAFSHPVARQIILDHLMYLNGYLSLEQHTVARWVVTGRIGITGAVPDLRYASYVDFRPRRPGFREDTRSRWPPFREDTLEEQHLLDALNGVPIDQYGPAIQREIESRFTALMGYSPSVNQIGVPTLGVTITLQQALMIAAPSILFLFVLFAASRALEIGPDGKMLSPSLPQFRSPADPLHLPLPATLAEVLERLVWLIFVLVPLLIPMIGTLTRYDFQGLEESQRTFDMHWPAYEDHSWAALLLRRRSWDETSGMVDLVTLICLCLQMLLAVEVTGTSRGRKRRGPWLGVCAAATSVALTWYVFHARNNVVIACAVVGGVTMVAAVWRRSALMVIVCGVCVIGSIVLLTTRVPW